jgi:hypothetical protein
MKQNTQDHPPNPLPHSISRPSGFDFFGRKKCPTLGSIPDPPGSNPHTRLFYPCTQAYKASIRLTRAPRPTRPNGRVTSENRSDHHGVTLILVGKRVLRVTHVVLSPSGRFHFFDPGDSNHRPSVARAWVRTQVSQHLPRRPRPSTPYPP